VVGGTLFRPGDGVELPKGISWEEGLRPRGNADTTLSPYDLRLAFDSFTRSWKLGPPPTSAALPEHEARERDLLARDVSTFLHGDGENPPSEER
jgi:hypothetical protein